MTRALLSILASPEPPAKPELLKALRPYGFKNPTKAWKEMSSFFQNAFDRESWGAVVPLMLVEFSKSADPDLSLAQFVTYTENSFHRTQLFEYLLKAPSAREALAKIFGLSPYMASILYQQPALLYWLFDEDGLYSKFSKVRLLEAMGSEVATADDLEGKLNALRRVKKRQMLRIGARDLLGLADVKQLTFELSGLADGLLEMTSRLGQEKLGPPPAGGRFVVLGMGKLGGQELNYNSDVDLLFLYEANGSGDKEKSRRYYNELAEWVIHAMADPSPQGNLFKVDMRLRPEGMGDMAKTYESYLEHYETRSQPWELQALIKARPCAGDKELGERFLKDLEPLIYRKSFDPSILKEMREIMSLIKKKMETKGSAKTNVKLGKGGIREIEFMVQLFQLVHGGQRPEIRRANTLEALEILEKNGLLLKADAVFLAEAYRFLRNTEHHLQMVQGLQTHTLPKKLADMERLARSLGFKPPGEGLATAYFKAYFLEVTLRVNSLYREVFKIKDRLDPSAQVVQASLEENREDLERNLEAGFFFDPSQAASNLMALSRRLKKSSGPKGEILWAAFVPDLFKGLKKVPHPDRALNQMESFLRATSLPDLYIRYLRENPKLFDLLLELFSNSLFLSQILIVHPGNFDIVLRALSEKTPQSVQDFIQNLEERLAEAPGWDEKLNLLRDVRNGEILRVGMQDLLGKRDLFDCFAELSRLATALTRSALGVATDQMGLPTRSQNPSVPKGFCVMAMGKLGAREMNYGSDLDVLYIYGDEEGKEIGFQTYVKLAETFVKTVASPTAHGIAYKVDARLRPMGREAQMVHSVEAYRQYFSAYGQAAERLAYTRAVFLAGDREVALQVEKEIEKFTYAKGLSRKDLDEIYDIRGQMEEKAKKAKGIEIKLSPGGIVDIEFFVQVLQVALGEEHPELRVPHIPTAMRYLREERIVPVEVLDELRDAYRFFRLIEARHRMVRETADDELPEEPERLVRLSWRMGLGHEKLAGEQLVEKIERIQARVRELFNRLPEWVKFTD
jgi:glutamate-ammonia-ligase adenylyltransferase